MSKRISHQLIRAANKEAGIFIKGIYLVERLMELGGPPPLWRVLSWWRYWKKFHRIRLAAHYDMDKYLEEQNTKGPPPPNPPKPQPTL